MQEQEGDGKSVEGEYEVVKLDGQDIELVYQTPERALNKTSVALLFLAHGCSHSATDFFDKGPLCKKCIGLPIERHIVCCPPFSSPCVHAST